MQQDHSSRTVTLDADTRPCIIRCRQQPHEALRNDIARVLGLANAELLPLDAIEVGPHDYASLEQEVRVWSMKFPGEQVTARVRLRRPLPPGLALITLPAVSR